MEIDLNFLRIQNPWWLGHDIDFDHVIEKYEDQELKVVPNFFNEIELHEDKIYTVYGARGIGKTTAFKLLIFKLIKKENVDPKNIFYYSSHNIDSYEQLNELIKIFILWRRKELNNRDRLYIFIDEITLVSDWQMGLKFMKEAELFEDITIFLSGSALFDPENNILSNEEMIMRRLSYKDLVRLLDRNLYNRVKRENHNCLLGNSRMEYYLDVFMLTGGFIPAINSFKKNAKIDQEEYNKYLDWFNGDITKLGRDLILARQILKELILSFGNNIGYKTITQRTKARMHVTIQEYISIFESLFAIKTVYQVGDDMLPAKSKAKKMFFRDPFLYWTFFSYIYGSLNNWQFACERLHQESIFNSLVENVIFSHLISDEDLDDWGEKVMYWRDANSQKEINFVYRHEGSVLPILNRYNQKITIKDKKIFEKANFSKGIIITNNELNLDNPIKLVPFTCFLFNKPFEFI